MAVISIKTDEENNYLGVELYFYKDNMSEDKLFNTGDVVVDWFHAQRFWFTEVREQDEDESNKIISGTDSVDSFLFNQKDKNYIYGYLHNIEEAPEIKYLTKETPFKARGVIEFGGMELIIPGDKQWDWKEYITYCKNDVKSKTSKRKSKTSTK